MRTQTERLCKGKRVIHKVRAVYSYRVFLRNIGNVYLRHGDVSGQSHTCREHLRTKTNKPVSIKKWIRIINCNCGRCENSPVR